MTTAHEVEFATLDETDARAFLARQHLGRIAFSLRDRVDIEPISYSFDHGWILGRTSVGAKLATLSHNQWCAFEADVVTGPFNWTSVVAKGGFQILDPETGSPDVYARAVKSVQALAPDAFSDADPSPHRNVLFGIYVSEITGRSAKRR